MESHGFEVTLTRGPAYQFSVRFNGLSTRYSHHIAPDLVMDEPPPLGEGNGPNAARILAAAIGNCLSASLLYCLERAHIPVGDMKTTVTGELARNDRGRLRVGKLRVEIMPEVGLESPRGERCLSLFEDFCAVTQSVREGIDVEVAVHPVVTAEIAG